MKFFNALLFASLLVGSAVASSIDSTSPELTSRDISAAGNTPEELLAREFDFDELDLIEREATDAMFELDEREPIFILKGIRIAAKIAKGVYNAVQSRKHNRDLGDLEDEIAEEVLRRMMEEDDMEERDWVEMEEVDERWDGGDDEELASRGLVASCSRC